MHFTKEPTAKMAVDIDVYIFHPDWRIPYDYEGFEDFSLTVLKAAFNRCRVIDWAVFGLYASQGKLFPVIIAVGASDAPKEFSFENLSCMIEGHPVRLRQVSPQEDLAYELRQVVTRPSTLFCLLESHNFMYVAFCRLPDPW